MKTPKLSALVAALTVTVVGLIGFTPVSAGASNATITGSASCASNGMYSVTWTVTTIGVPAGQSATVSQVGVSPYTPVSGLPATVSGDASVTFVQSDIPASDSEASEDVLVTWGDTSVNPSTGYATLAGTCMTSPAPPPTPPPTTTTTTTQPPVTQPTSGSTGGSGTGVAQPTTAAAVTPTTTPPPSIAFTGGNTETTAGIGMGLLAVGAGLVLAARRRSVSRVGG